MGGIDSASVDRPDWTPELVEKEVRRACEEYGTKYYIPCITQVLESVPSRVFMRQPVKQLKK